MLLFSEYLRELMKDKQISVSSLARLTGMERTHLSKVLTGSRTLPYHALDELIYHPRLTPSEEKRLRSYYDDQFEKKGTRHSHELVGKLFWSSSVGFCQFACYPDNTIIRTTIMTTIFPHIILIHSHTFS